MGCWQFWEQRMLIVLQECFMFTNEVYTVRLVWLAVTFSSSFWPYYRGSDVSCGPSSPTKEGKAGG